MEKVADDEACCKGPVFGLNGRDFGGKLLEASVDGAYDEDFLRHAEGCFYRDVRGYVGSRKEKCCTRDSTFSQGCKPSPDENSLSSLPSDHHLRASPPITSITLRRRLH